MNQRFDGPVDQVAAGDIHNHVNPLGRLLTKAERIELNTLVQRLENDFGEPGWQTWRFLHRTIGVDSIETMCIGHRDSAQELLNLLTKCAELQKSADAQPVLITEPDRGNSFSAEIESMKTELNKARREIARLSRRVAAEENRVVETSGKLALFKGEVQRQEVLLARTYDQISLLKSDAAATRKRINRLKLVSLLLAIIALGSVMSSAYHSKTTEKTEASLVPLKKGMQR